MSLLHWILSSTVTFVLICILWQCCSDNRASAATRFWGVIFIAIAICALWVRP